MKRSGSADLALMGGSIPKWLFDRMVRLSGGIVEAIVIDKGPEEFLRRISDPFWFQSFGSVIGMDWNSSGVTTAVMRALKKSINPQAQELGLYVCGGKGKQSLETPRELLRVGDATGLDGNELARFSKLSAKVDNTAVQDGFQLYLHNFIVSKAGDWSVIQQGMQPKASTARRYHWHSASIQSFVEEPHAAICGDHQGDIINLVDKRSAGSRSAIVSMAGEHPEKMEKEIRKLVMPQYKTIRAGDVDMKRLGGVLQLAHESRSQNFEEILLLKGLGPRTMQSLALVSEVIYGAPSRFSDPARFAFAHGGKGGNPFPVPTHVYDETISTLQKSVEKARLGLTDKQEAIRKLSLLAQKAEMTQSSIPSVEEVMEKEKKDAWKHGGRTKAGYEQPPQNGQLNLFD